MTFRSSIFNVQTLMASVLVLATLYLLNSGLSGLHMLMELTQRNFVFSTPSLVVIMPVNNNTDLQFYQNMWIHEHLHTVCDFDGPGCSIVCNRPSTWANLAEKTRCFSRSIQSSQYPKAEFYIKLDDDALVDRQYVFDLMEKYKYHRQPVYISDFILNLDRLNPNLNGTVYGNGKFYMFNRKLLECLDTEIWYRGRRNEDAVFGSMVRSGCGSNVLRIAEDDTKIWHKRYSHKNKFIHLAALANH